MKYAIVALLLAFSVTEANAVVYCAAGAYRAGCVRRPPVAGAVVATPAAACRYVVVNGVRVRRCYGLRVGVVYHPADAEGITLCA